MFGKVVEAVEQVLGKSSVSIADIEGIGVGVPGKVDFEKELPFFKIIYLGGSFLFRSVCKSNLVFSGS